MLKFVVKRAREISQTKGAREEMEVVPKVAALEDRQEPPTLKHPPSRLIPFAKVEVAVVEVAVIYPTVGEEVATRVEVAVPPPAISVPMDVEEKPVPPAGTEIGANAPDTVCHWVTTVSKRSASPEIKNNLFFILVHIYLLLLPMYQFSYDNFYRVCVHFLT